MTATEAKAIEKEQNVLEGDSNACDQLYVPFLSRFTYYLTSSHSTVPNQLNSPLLRLPAELRNRIYAYTFEPGIHWYCKAAFLRNSYFWTDSEAEPMALLSCRQVNFEAKGYLLKHRHVLTTPEYLAMSGFYFSAEKKHETLWWERCHLWVPMKAAIPKIRLVVSDDRVQTSGNGAVVLQQTLILRLEPAQGFETRCRGLTPHWPRCTGSSFEDIQTRGSVGDREGVRACRTWGY
jgi:hypothetical protein